jgi:hypothetical protein
MELSDVLSDKEPEKQESEAPPVETEKQDYSSTRDRLRARENEARGRDPNTGKFTPKEEAKEEPKVEVKPEAKPEAKVEPKREEFTEKERAFLRGLEEERRKRQELERRLADYEKEKTSPTEKKTFWDDPEGALKNFEQGLEQKLTQREMNTKLQTSEVIARSRYQDFDEKVEIFASLMKDTPALGSQMVSAPDPAEFVYNTAKKHKMLQEAGSIDSLREKIEKETRAKIEAEYKAKQEEIDKQRAALTGSLSEVRGGSTQQKPVYSGPTSLDDILKGK